MTHMMNNGQIREFDTSGMRLSGEIIIFNVGGSIQRADELSIGDKVLAKGGWLFTIMDIIVVDYEVQVPERQTGANYILIFRETFVQPQLKSDELVWVVKSADKVTQQMDTANGKT
jgi:hypothetical protein